MRHQQILPLALTLFLAFVLTACGSSPGGPPGDDEPVIPESTRVPDAETLDSLTEVGEDGTLVFAASNGFLADLESGDVIVAGPGGAAPEGLLRRVTSVREEAGQVVVETEPTTIDEAVHRGSVDVERALTPADLETAHLHMQGVTLQTLDPQAQGFRFDFDQTVVDEDGNPATTNDRLQITGYLQIDPILDFELDVNRFLDLPTGINVFKVAVGITEHAEVNVIGDYDKAGSVSREFNLATLDFAPLTFPIGPVPVVITPELELSVKLDGSIDATLRMHVEQSFEAQAGVLYTASGGWENLSHVTHDFQWDDPTYGAALNARAYASARLGFKIYDTAGSYITASAFGELDVDLFRDPVWKINAGITADVGLYAEVLSVKLADYNARVLELGWNLDSGSFSTGPTPDPKQVLIDASHGFDDGGSGIDHVAYFEDLIYSLQQNDYEVSVAIKNLSTILGESPIGVVLLAGPTLPYEETEIEALVAFVERGGRLVILGEWGASFGTVHLNDVAAAFSVSINNDQAGDFDSAHNGDPNWPLTTRISSGFATGVSSVAFYTTASIAGGEPIARTEPTGFSTSNPGVHAQIPVATRVLHGDGQVIVVGDTDAFAVDYSGKSIGIRTYDNCRFALNVMGGGSACPF